MDSRLYNIVNYKTQNAEQLIQDRFTASFMSNTKWVKLINILTYKLDKVFLNYKLIYDEVIEGSLFNMADTEPYFIEPILYKEVEWIEFPNEYEDWINLNNLKAGKHKVKQNIDEIKSALDKQGIFDLELYDGKIRLFGYK
jgi:hypothetical protein